MVDRKIAVITGACGGMGRCVARRLAADYALVLTDRDQAALDGLAAELGDAVLLARAAELSDPAAIEALVAAPGAKLDVLVHTAGLSPAMADWRTILEINLIASERLTQAVLARANEGVVAVLISSIAGVGAPRGTGLDAILDAPLAEDFHERLDAAMAQAGQAQDSGMAYVFSKYGVARLVKRMAKPFAAKGGRIVAVAPGLIDTPMGRLEFAPGQPGAEMVPLTPLGRLGRPDEIAAVAVFLTTDGASFVSGVEWVVDGGITSTF